MIAADDAGGAYRSTSAGLGAAGYGIRRDLTPLARWFFLGADRLDCVRDRAAPAAGPAPSIAFEGVGRPSTRSYCACARVRARTETGLPSAAGPPPGSAS